MRSQRIVFFLYAIAISHLMPTKASDDFTLISAAYLLCFTADPGQNSEPNTKSPFLIDEFKIWNYAKTEFDLQ